MQAENERRLNRDATAYVLSRVHGDGAGCGRVGGGVRVGVGGREAAV